LIKNSHPFLKKFQKITGGDFFYSHCSIIDHAARGASDMFVCTEIYINGVD